MFLLGPTLDREAPIIFGYVNYHAMMPDQRDARSVGRIVVPIFLGFIDDRPPSFDRAMLYLGRNSPAATAQTKTEMPGARRPNRPCLTGTESHDYTKI